VRDLTRIKSSLKDVLKALRQIGLLELKYNPYDRCGFHSSMECSLLEIPLMSVSNSKKFARLDG